MRMRQDVNFGWHSGPNQGTVVKKLDRWPMLATLPQQREKLSATLADPKFGRGECHLGIYRFLAAFWQVFSLLTEQLAFP